jgi:hypothetical protein
LGYPPFLCSARLKEDSLVSVFENTRRLISKPPHSSNMQSWPFIWFQPPVIAVAYGSLFGAVIAALVLRVWNPDIGGSRARSIAYLCLSGLLTFLVISYNIAFMPSMPAAALLLFGVGPSVLVGAVVLFAEKDSQ